MTSGIDLRRQKLRARLDQVYANLTKSNYVDSGMKARLVLEDILVWLHEEAGADTDGLTYKNIDKKLLPLVRTPRIVSKEQESLIRTAYDVFNGCCHTNEGPQPHPPPSFESVSRAIYSYFNHTVTWFETTYLDPPSPSIASRFSRIEPGMYSGRGRDMKEVHTLLRGDYGQVVISGSTGVGKTEFAREYADRFRNEYPGGIVWIDARGTPSEMLRQIEVAFQRVKLVDPLAGGELRPEPESAAQIYWQLWRPGRRLLIFDNVPGDRVNATRAFFPDPAVTPDFDVMVTSQKNWPTPGNHILHPLTDDESLDLFRAFLGPLRVDREKEVAILTATWVGCLPVALELTARFMLEHPEESFAEVLERLKEEGVHGAVLATEGNAAQRNWMTSFMLVWNSFSTAEHELLHLIACLPAGPVVQSLVAEVFERARSANGTRSLRDASSKLTSWNVLKTASGEKDRIEVHELIRLSARQITGIDERAKQPADKGTTFTQAADLRQVLGKMMHESALAFSRAEEPDRLKKWRPYVDAWAETAICTSIVPSASEAIEILLNATEYRHVQGAAADVIRLTESTKFGSASLETEMPGRAKHIAGKLHHWRAKALRVSGRYQDAVALISQMETDPSLGQVERSRVMLHGADVKRLQGLYDQAETAYSKAAAVARLAPNDREMNEVEADAEYGLARILRLTGRHGGALQAYDATRKLRDRYASKQLKSFGTAWPEFGLGEAYRLQWDLERSRAHYAQALQIFGEDLEGQSYAFWGLGECDRLSGKFAEARMNYEESLRACLKTGDLRSRVWALIGLGCVESGIGLHEKAVDIFDRAAGLVSEEVERTHLRLCRAIANRRLNQATEADFEACLEIYSGRGMSYCIVQILINQALLPEKQQEERIRQLNSAESESAAKGYIHELATIVQARAGKDRYVVNLP